MPHFVHGRSQPREHQVYLPKDELIISKTDTKGCITYANRTFMRICGFAEHELLGKPHNLIRHQDMPRGAFRLMWHTLKQQREFFAFVKNRTAAHDYYWVFANITPDFDTQGQLKGYFSVRRQANPQALNLIIPLYQQMCMLEQQTDQAHAPDASIRWLTQKIVDTGHSDYTQFVLALQGELA